MENGKQVLYLSSWRSEKGNLSQRELAELSGVSQLTISNYERKGINSATHGILKKLAKALDIEVYQIKG